MELTKMRMLLIGHLQVKVKLLLEHTWHICDDQASDNVDGATRITPQPIHLRHYLLSVEAVAQAQKKARQRVMTRPSQRLSLDQAQKERKGEEAPET